MLMAKFKSKVSKSHLKTISLRTTIPSPVVEMLGLKDGDTLVWEVEPKGDKVVVRVSIERL
jgi:bifunctional DNA-binding transcriptional regulator/antitoxin component of YhaV-PrlF toxin-antitoxin module